MAWRPKIMICRQTVCSFRLLAALLTIATGAFGQRAGVKVVINAEQAEAVLGIVTGEDAWARLWSSDGYARLKKREAEMGRAFTDDQFRVFVESSELKRRAAVLSATLDEWRNTDITAACARILPYLPPEAELRATVYLVIKPQNNSFVYELATNPAIFLYLDPAKTKEQFENTLAHELHHIGLASVSRRMEQQVERLPPGVRAAVGWLGAFGEGLAMLAAAGSPDIHPHRDSSAEDRTRWDHDVSNAGNDMRAIEVFLLEVIAGKLSEQEQRSRGMSFFGVQGPWYTVGWKMAVTVEKAFGRTALVDCIRDFRRLLVLYNEAAGSAGLPRWSAELLAALGAP